MARDLKLANWTWTTATAGAGIMAVTPSTPTGDPTNTAAAITLAVASLTGYRAFSDAKNVAGFRNSKIQPISGTLTVAQLQAVLENQQAGNEVTAVANDPALPGNTSYGEMYARCAVSIGAQLTGATVTWNNTGFIVMEGAFDNGVGAADTAWSPISAAAPLTLPAAQLAASLVTVTSSNLFTTVVPHKLVIGDFIVFDSITGLAGAGVPVVAQTYVVQNVVSPYQFVIAAVSAPTTPLVVTGTPTVNSLVRKLLSGNGISRIISLPLVQSVRPWMRWALYYNTVSTTNVSTVTISKTSLTLGKDNAVAY